MRPPKTVISSLHVEPGDAGESPGTAQNQKNKRIKKIKNKNDFLN